VASAAVAGGTYLFLYQRQISRFVVDAPGLLADTNLHRFSQVAIRWLAIARSTWRITPYLLVFLAWVGLNAAVVAGFWKLIDSSLGLEAKVGVCLVVFSVYFAVGIAVPVVRHGGQRQRPVFAVTVGSTIFGLLLLAGMGLGIWKLLDSQFQTGGKTVACFALLCYTTLMALVPTLLLRRKRSARPKVTPDSCSI